MPWLCREASREAPPRFHTLKRYTLEEWNVKVFIPLSFAKAMQCESARLAAAPSRNPFLRILEIENFKKIFPFLPFLRFGKAEKNSRSACSAKRDFCYSSISTTTPSVMRFCTSSADASEPRGLFGVTTISVWSEYPMLFFMRKMPDTGLILPFCI